MLPAESRSTCFSKPLAPATNDGFPRPRPGDGVAAPVGEPVIGSTGADSARRPWPWRG